MLLIWSFIEVFDSGNFGIVTNHTHAQPEIAPSPKTLNEPTFRMAKTILVPRTPSGKFANVSVAWIQRTS